MILTIGAYRPINVASHANASKIYQAIRDASGEGASTFPDGHLSDGHRISYNGRVWLGDELIMDVSTEQQILAVVSTVMQEICGTQPPETPMPFSALEAGLKSAPMSKTWTYAKMLAILWHRKNRHEALISCRNIAKSLGVSID